MANNSGKTKVITGSGARLSYFHGWEPVSINGGAEKYSVSVLIPTSWFLGYAKDENGKLVIVPEEAEVVRRINRDYLDGASLMQIKRGLEADGIPNGAKHTKWYDANIRQILTNEKYIGNALLQKTYTVSVLDKKRSRNNGEMPKYYVEGCHEPIIDRAVFLLVQEEMARRTSLRSRDKPRTYSSKYALSGIVFCPHCGGNYRRVVCKVARITLQSGCAGYNGFSIWRYRRNGLNTGFYGRSRMQSYCKLQC